MGTPGLTGSRLDANDNHYHLALDRVTYMSGVEESRQDRADLAARKYALDRGAGQAWPNPS